MIFLLSMLFAEEPKYKNLKEGELDLKIELNRKIVGDSLKWGWKKDIKEKYYNIMTFKGLVGDA